MCKVSFFYITSEGNIVCEYDLNVDLKIKTMSCERWKRCFYSVEVTQFSFKNVSYYYDNAL